MGDFGNLGVALAIIAVVVGGSRLWDIVQRRWQARRTGRQREKNEALFRSMFPELQPYFHPERIAAFVFARLAREEKEGVWQWANPAGFAAATMAHVSPDPRGERVRLVDAAGKAIAEFVCDMHPEGRVLRVGSGKFTVDMRDWSNPRVRYWHPQREFKWFREGWEFKTPIAEEPFRSSSFTSSDNSSLSSGSSSGGTRTAAGFAGLGGTFDGGGASAGWDAAAADSASGKTGSAAAAVSASDSSGDSASTAY